jgi:quinol monooxygenase YgiN
MKLIFTAFLLTAAITFLFTGCEKEKITSVDDGKNNLFVLVKYKAQPGKHEEALSALNSLILEVKKEPHFVNIKMFVDPSDSGNILLYEQWTDEAYYKGGHMNTPHLQNFMGDAREFLAGPPDISSWKLSQNYSLD